MRGRAASMLLTGIVAAAPLGAADGPELPGLRIGELAWPAGRTIGVETDPGPVALLRRVEPRLEVHDFPDLFRAQLPLELQVRQRGIERLQLECSRAIVGQQIPG